MQDEVISSGWHWSYGWLRRSENDDHRGFCYEKPDGVLVYTMRRDHRLICRLECRRDPVTGRLKVVISNGTTRGYIQMFGARSYSTGKKAA